jgi:hypothetical protein
MSLMPQWLRYHEKEVGISPFGLKKAANHLLCETIFFSFSKV